MFSKYAHNNAPPWPSSVQEHLLNEQEAIERFAFIRFTASAPPDEDPPFESFHSHHSKRWLFSSNEATAFCEERVWWRKEALKAEREVVGLLRSGRMAPSIGLKVWRKMVEWMEREERREKKGIVFVFVFVFVFVVVVVVVVVVNELCVCVDLAGMVCVDCGVVVMFVKSVSERWRSKWIWRRRWRREEEEDNKGEKRKGLRREMKEEKEEWEMEKEAGIGECASGRRF
ncbi:uncharacterized protein MONOS_665 [Monocercomonoides exilis]|uniref:uncharacterized protein n=1 Tax=Monocercomonoides exilis TaxID=2049356 RepID=UPI00355A9CA9|nr:hypothetical protein MONOS_665 [Monocercomonoides exilis]|eukprot:MONOS_665.1-p1 / transcript=MONOS_665.1 / gene=MONOS_665 / organism=Monocercomonoides_exilis_PA203 / gene_product=unspecified product / transcript_product=unspecified product / location=Mono_scaffold00011:91227-91961(-) / protein_length=229 / sequence_SO=supercontig / SO=protein_coding / is_pseudo=false